MECYLLFPSHPDATYEPQNKQEYAIETSNFLLFANSNSFKLEAYSCATCFRILISAYKILAWF